MHVGKEVRHRMASMASVVVMKKDVPRSLESIHPNQVIGRDRRRSEYPVIKKIADAGDIVVI